MSQTVKQFAEYLLEQIETGNFRADDRLIVEFWSFQDVEDFAYGDDYYGEVTDEVAREVWHEVADRLEGLDLITNDDVRDSISDVFDQRLGAN